VFSLHHRAIFICKVNKGDIFVSQSDRSCSYTADLRIVMNPRQTTSLKLKIRKHKTIVILISPECASYTWRFSHLIFGNFEQCMEGNFVFLKANLQVHRWMWPHSWKACKATQFVQTQLEPPKTNRQNKSWSTTQKSQNLMEKSKEQEN